jgi:uncharacterized protein
MVQNGAAMTTSSYSTRSLPSQIWRALALLVLILAVVVHAAAGWVFSDRLIDGAFTPSPTLEFGDPTATSLAITEVSYASPIGEFDAWYIAGARNQWVIHVHGKGATLEEAIPAAEALAPAGYNQMIIGYRNDSGQPSDPSGYYRYGVTEWRDLEAAIEWAVGNGATELAAFGYSTGAAIVLSYHYKNSDAPLRAFVFDSPNIDMGATIDLAASQERLIGNVPLPFTIIEIAKTLTALRISVNWESLDYLRRIDGLSVPTLVFHGTADATVPIEVSRALADARPQLVELIEVVDADHVATRAANPAAYDQRILAFLAAKWR